MGWKIKYCGKSYAGRPSSSRFNAPSRWGQFWVLLYLSHWWGASGPLITPGFVDVQCWACHCCPISLPACNTKVGKWHEGDFAGVSDVCSSNSLETSNRNMVSCKFSFFFFSVFFSFFSLMCYSSSELGVLVNHWNFKWFSVLLYAYPWDGAIK